MRSVVFSLGKTPPTFNWISLLLNEEGLVETIMNHAEALDLRAGEMVSLIGAGGKTTMLFRLAKELCDGGGKILITTTTKTFKPARPHVDRLFLIEDVNAFFSATAQIQAPVIVGAGYEVDAEGQLVGLPMAWLDQLAQSAHSTRFFGRGR